MVPSTVIGQGTMGVIFGTGTKCMGNLSIQVSNSQERLYCVTIGREGSGEMDELKVQKEGTGNVCTGTF